MYSHIINGHYMFGNTFIQPEMMHYRNIAHHNLAPVIRPFPPYPDIKQCECSQTGCGYYEDCSNRIDTPYTNPDENSDDTCTDCPLCSNGIVRDPLIYNVVNVETSIVKTLKVTLYGVSKDMDKTVEMKQGGRYAVTYITESGLITSVGYLELISDSVPDECTRYINSSSAATASSAYIGMDCSTEGHSNRCKIYIATIRSIQDLNDDEEAETIETKSMRERLQELLDAIDKGELVFCKKEECCTTTEQVSTDDLEHTDNESSTDSESGSTDGAENKLDEP